ncbi:Os10g0422700, partial [Oryza sativa Japonica Group]
PFPYPLPPLTRWRRRRRTLRDERRVRSQLLLPREPQRAALEDDKVPLAERLPTRADGAPQGRSGSPETEWRKGQSPRWSDCGCESCRTWQRHDNGRLHFVVNQPQPPNGLNSQVSTASVISVTIIRLPPPPSVVDSNRGRRRRFAPPADDPTNTSPANGVLEESPWSACGAREGREESSACRVLRPLLSAVSRCTDPPPRQPPARPPRQ